MPTLPVINARKEKVGELELSDALFDESKSMHVVWEVVRHHLAARRSGTHSVKGRGDVAGAGRKPWKQKGTGRARVGSVRVPLWRHGGIVHGPTPRSYDHPIPKKKRRVAACRVLASMLAKDRITVVDALVDEPKTRAFRGFIDGLGLTQRALVLVEGVGENLRRSTANLADVKLVTPEGVNAYDLLKYRRLLATPQAMGRLQEILGR